MKIIIENINLELVNFPENLYESLEKEIVPLLKKNIFNYIESNFKNTPETDNYKVDIITIDEKVKSESSLEINLNRIAQKIYAEIQYKKQPQHNSTNNITKAIEIKQAFFDYIINGKNWAIFQTSTWKEIYQNNKLNDWLKEFVETNKTWSTPLFSRLLDFYSVDEIIQNFPIEVSKVYPLKAIKKLHKNEQVHTLINLFQNKTLQLETSLESEQTFEKKSSEKLVSIKNIENENNKTKTNDKKQIVDNKNDEWIPIQNAGLFILHPFYSKLLKELNILQDNAIQDFDLAIYVLHYIAFPEDITPKNHELISEKILLDLPLNYTMQNFPILKEFEINLIKKTQDNILQLWQALSGSSFGFIQQMFIQREAFAKRNSKGWTIHIPQQAQDILLEKLPWGLGIVKLPWMKELIDVKIN